jgi:hypothetical protein
MTVSNSGLGRRWDDLFALRKTLRYKPEDRRLLSTHPNSLTHKRKLLARIFGAERNPLHPPNAFKYPALHRFLQDDNGISARKSPFLTSIPNEIVLRDERNDPKSDGKSLRAWDSAVEDGYLQYPPTGVIKESKAMRLPHLLKTLSTSVSL